jgi:NADH-quinone oxidoreductase subunit G
MFGNEIQRITGRKDQYGEVEEFICNTCRFDKKEVSDWTIEGPKQFNKDSVINQNNYIRPLEKVIIETENFILEGRKQDQVRISMSGVPLKNTQK